MVQDREKVGTSQTMLHVAEHRHEMDWMNELCRAETDTVGVIFQSIVTLGLDNDVVDYEYC